MSEELPLNDKPPRVVIKSATAQFIMQGLRATQECIDILEDLKVGMPGVKLSISALKAKLHEDRVLFLTRLFKTAQAAKVDFSKWVVAGAKWDGDEPCVDFMSIDKIDPDEP